ncbi:MarR family transcriptional regulator [Lichenihabitans sp. PAMC28606]|uniref:MarR family winged helix-turn-helix transcriptional regulator n=1 Tax=Lichenihabitans sp. PAMC28606 TaxID=2880932 RepID=UPI001D0B3EA4|nr:MarR family transcriptional regulator [Lichenihabitans sp. PAMC28606]UDL95625.1 MarR family transcriptional regulator [Lichenihabitans sp. PAMC28606]
MTIDDAFFAEHSLKTPDDSLGFVLWRATHAWQRFLDQDLSVLDLTHLRFALLVALAWLSRDNGHVTQRRLADFLAMHPMQVSQVVTALEKGGLLERRPSSLDRRALALCLSSAGEIALRRSMPIVEDAHRRFFDKPGIQCDEVRRSLLAMLG